MSTYIITGGAGFIGCNIARELVRQKQKAKSRTNPWFGTRIKIIDNLSTGNIDNLDDIKDDVEFIEGDIRNQKFLQKHFAGADFIYTDVWASMGQEAEAEARKKVFKKFYTT